jgi:hypothetical protein
MFSLKMRIFPSRFLIVFALLTSPSAIRAQAPSFPYGIFFIFEGTFEYSGNHQGLGGTMVYYDSIGRERYEELQYLHRVPIYNNGHLHYQETDTISSNLDMYYTLTLDLSYDSVAKTISSFNYSRNGTPRYGEFGGLESEHLSLSLQNLRYDSGSIYFDDSNLANYLVSATYGISSESADGNDNVTLKTVDTLYFENSILIQQGPNIVIGNNASLGNRITISVDNRTLHISPIQQPLSISIYDLVGKQIKSLAMSPGGTSIQLNDLTSGCYFIQAGGTCVKALLF